MSPQWSVDPDAAKALSSFMRTPQNRSRLRRIGWGADVPIVCTSRATALASIINTIGLDNDEMLVVAPAVDREGLSVAMVRRERGSGRDSSARTSIGRHTSVGMLFDSHRFLARLNDANFDMSVTALEPA